MITKIEKKALEFVAEGEAPLWGRGFVEGATWASQKNEKELAAIRASMNWQRKALEMVIEENKALRAENAKLRDALEGVMQEIPDFLLESGVSKLMVSTPNLIRAKESINSTPPDPMYSSAPEMLELAKMFLRADAEANSGDYGAGMCDCKDNDGGRYQSEFLASALKRMAALVDKIEVSPTPADGF